MVGIIAPQFAGAVTKKELPPELQYNYDPKKAKALLAEAGHPNGVTIPCFTSQREDYAALMLMLQEQLRAAGINLDLKIIDHATMHAENRKDRNAVALYSSSFPPVPTQPFLQLLSAAAEVKADGGGAENYSHYGVAMPGIDALIEKAQDEPDFNKRIALIQEIEKQVLRDLPAAGHHHPLLRHRPQPARRHGIPGQVRLRLLASEQGQARVRPVGGQAMLRVIGARLLDAVPTVLLVLTLVFIALRLLPGDPALVALGDYATPEQLALFREQMGLNVPLWQQYFVFIWDMLTLDFGQSLIDRRPVLQLLAENLPYTIELTLVATGMGLFIGVPLGVMAAVNRNRLPDAGVRVFSLVGYAIPDFYLGALLLIVFALNLGWFPINGGGAGFVDRMYHVFLPALTLAMVKTAFLGRLTRTSLLEVLRQGLHPHRAGEGRAGEPRHLPARTAQRPAAGHDRPGAQRSRDPVRLGRDRARLQPAGHRRGPDQRHRQAGLSGHPGRRRGLRLLRRSGEPAGRPRLHRRRSQNPGEVMSLAIEPEP